MTLVYATTADLADWSSLPSPVNATQLLRSASILVRNGTMTARYATDEDGLPTDPKVVAAFREATCAQATLWQATGIDPATGAMITTNPVASKGIGTARISYDTSAAASVAALSIRRDAATSLCTDAWLILQQAGLVPGGVGRG